MWPKYSSIWGFEMMDLTKELPLPVVVQVSFSGMNGSFFLFFFFLAAQPAE
jgi:hypothetical protein